MFLSERTSSNKQQRGIRVSLGVLHVLTSSYELQTEDMDEGRKKQEVGKVNTELLRKLQELETDIVFSTG